MKYYVIIPAYNEALFLGMTLESLVQQTLQPAAVVVVNDHSTDATEAVIDAFAARYPFIKKVNHHSSAPQLPGGNVVQAFTKGLQELDETYDFLVKLDADLSLPKEYFETIARLFRLNPQTGMAGGFAYEAQENGWKRHHPMNPDHVRGAFKAYTQACFKAIGGLRPAMGWDTADELLARYHGFEVRTEPSLRVRHLRPTGARYAQKNARLQGEAFYNLRYGWLLLGLAALKIAYQQRSLTTFTGMVKGFFAARATRNPPMVSPAEGAFIRSYRYRGLLRKLRAGTGLR